MPTQPQKKIPQLNAASLPITGTLLFEGDQGGNSVKVSIQNILDIIPVPSGLLPVTQQSGTAYTLTASDAQTMVEFTNPAAIGVTVPNNGSVPIPIGSTVNIAQDNTGTVTVIADSGVTIKSYANMLALIGRNAGATLYKTGTNTWRLFGNLA